MSTSVEYEILLKNGQFTKAAQESERAIRNVGGAVEQTGEKHVSLRAQLREVREELVAMEQAGKRGTQAYSDLQDKAALLTDALSDANAQARILAHDQRGMQGVLSGLTGLSGAFSAAAGAAGLLGAEEDKLQAVMARIQNLMGITVGLQQLQQTLDKDSAFRLVVLNGLKKWWVKVQTEAAVADAAEAKAAGAGATAHTAHSVAATADTAATTAAATAATAGAGAFRLLGAAIKSIPVIGWVLAVISAAAAGVAAVVRRHKRAQKEMEEQAEAVAEKSREAARSIREATGQAAADGVTDIERLAAAYSKLGNNLQDKQRFVADNAEAFRKLGVEVRGVADAENLLIGNKDKFVQAQIAKATAQAYAEKAKELIKSNIALMGVDTSPRPQGPLGTGEMLSGTEGMMVRQARILRQTLQNLWKEAAKETAKAASLMSEFTPASGTTGNGSQHQDDAAEEELIGWVAKYWKLVDERDKAIEKIKSHLGETIHFDAGDVTYDADAIESEVAKIREKFNQDVIKLGEEYGELDIPVEVKPETDNGAYEQLLDEYADYMRKLANINKQYDEQLKNAGSDESLKGRINERRQQDIAALVMNTFKADEAIGKMAESISSLGKAARGAIADKLYKILQFAQNSRIKMVDAQSVKEFAELNGVSEELLNSLINNDAALEEFDKYVSDIGKQAKQIDTLKDAVDNYRKALDKAKSGKILDIDALEQAKGLLNDMIKALADNILDELNTIGDVMTQLGDLLGDDNLTTAGEFLNDFTSNIQAAEEGAQAWGGWWGAIIGGVSDLIPKIVKWMNAGTTKSLDDVEKMLSHTESMINYWREISNHSNWQANDYTQAFDTERVQELLDKIKQARKWIATDIADLGSSFLGRGWSVQKIKTLIESIKWSSNKITEHVNEIMGAIVDGVSISSKEAFDNMMSSYDKRMAELQDKLEVLLRNPKKNAEEINELLILIGETAQEKIDALLEHAESVVGVTSQQLFDDLFGMITDAFDAGKDSIDDFASYFNKTIANMIKNQVLTRLLADRIQQYIEDVAWHYDEGHLTGENAADYINWLRGYGEEIVKDGLDALEALRPIFEGLSVAVDDASTLSGSIKGITAEQAGMLAGQMNAMRTAQLQQVSLLTEQLDALNNIGNNTRYIREIYNYIRSGNAGGNLNRAYGQS